MDPLEIGIVHTQIFFHLPWKVAISLWCSQGIKELAKACVRRENLCCIHCCNFMANLDFMIVHCTNYPRVLLCVKWRNMPTHQQVDHRNAFSLWQVGWRMVLQQVSGCGRLGLMMTLMVDVDHWFMMLTTISGDGKNVDDEHCKQGLDGKDFYRAFT